MFRAGAGGSHEDAAKWSVGFLRLDETLFFKRCQDFCIGIH